MSIEKKLGLMFLGMLVFAFCGVLAIRLSDTTPEKPVNVDIRDPHQTAATPTATAAGSASMQFAGRPSAATPGNMGTQQSAGATRGAVGTSYGAGDNRYSTTAAGSATAGAPRYGSAGSAPAAGYPGMAGGSSAATAPGSGSLPPATASSDPFGRGSAPAAAAGLPTLPTSGAPTQASNPYASAGAASPPSVTLPTSSSSPSAATALSSSPPPTTGAGNPLRGGATADPTTATASSADRYRSAPGGYPTSGTAGGAMPTLPTTSSASTGFPTSAPASIAGAPPATMPVGDARPLNSASTGALPTSGSPGVAAISTPSPSMSTATLGAPSTSVGAPPTGFASSSPSAASGVATTSAVMPVAGQSEAAVQAKPYVVGPDDSFWSISEKVYGDGSYYRALFAFNNDRYPHAEDVRVGSVLDVPSVEVLKQRFPELIGSPTTATSASLTNPASRGTGAASYVVREGDTLFEIARTQLGKASRWTEIYQLNRQALGENLENLRPGVSLALPTGP